jgi:pimeloyl-ACP methyl ester carboxylesterase
MRRIVYLHGFASGPGSRKACFFRERLAEAGYELELPDLTAGDFEHLTMAGQMAVLESVVAGEAVTLIGSSLGGYLAALYAARHPETEKVVLLAPAFAFGGRWEALVGVAAFAEWRRTGKLAVHHYGDGRERELGFAIVEESAGCEAYPGFGQPGRIYHGLRDTVVPVEYSERFVARYGNAELTVVDSDHGMVDVLPQIWRGVVGFLGAEGGRKNISHR